MRKHRPPHQNYRVPTVFDLIKIDSYDRLEAVYRAHVKDLQDHIPVFHLLNKFEEKVRVEVVEPRERDLCLKRIDQYRRIKFYQ